jgi:hypothetical protein
MTVGDSKAAKERVMLKLIAVITLVAGLLLAARLFQNNPGDVPITGESREELIASSLTAAARNRNRAVLCGAVAVALCAGGVLLFVRGRRRCAAVAAPVVGSDVDAAQMRQALARWAGVALVRPVEVRYLRRYAVMAVGLPTFFVGAAALILAVNGFRQPTPLIALLCVAMAAVLALIQRKAARNAACRFDASGVTRGDGQRFGWGDFNGVHYLMMLKNGGAKELLWRIEIAFADGVAWIIPGRVANLAEINALVDAVPGPHEKRRA